LRVFLQTCHILIANPHIALLGNPNSGKSSLFNCLTGLNQKVGNFPGVTVEQKTGETTLPGGIRATIIDLPGSYSLYPRRSDEWIAYEALMQTKGNSPIDLFVIVADASNLRRNLLYVSQVIDLGKPVIVALTMSDLAARKGIRIDKDQLSFELQVPVLSINPRTNKGIAELRSAMVQLLNQKTVKPVPEFIPAGQLASAAVPELKELFPGITDYSAIHYLINHESFGFDEAMHEKIERIERGNQFNHTRVQAEDIRQRYARISRIMQKSVKETSREEKKLFSEKIDQVLLHRFWGYLIMFMVLFLLFQSVFWIAEYPMNAIEWAFGNLGSWLGKVLNESWFSNLLINGVLAGMSGILVFVPQIMILFGLITILEDTGYMARISFLSDKIMRKAGLNGKSVMPMISGFACAVPAIMSTRNIENRKERLLTILITPLMSCSARLPVFTILIALVIPKTYVLGFLSLQGLVMMGLYLLGLVMGLLLASVLKAFIRITEKSFFILELPLYRQPRWKNIGLTMIQKARIFVVDAGKVIMVISLLLWGLSSYGPEGKRDTIRSAYENLKKSDPANLATYETEQRAAMLETSYAGMIGRKIEPFIKPLGYDWKIGIALVTSFAAREVFVGTMATLYSVGGDPDENNPTLREKMHAAVRQDGSKVYTLATGVSLMIFYVLAMQCMSTLAIVKRETGSWKWPAIQFLTMTGIAYLMSMIAYQLLK
jgi:ferrous iron transport protein B